MPGRVASRKGPAERWPFLLALAGLLVTAYLTVVAWRGEGAAFCTEGGGCDVVQGSAWSTFLGLPVALWGFALYALLAVVAWRPGNALLRWRRLWRLSLLGLAVSLYLTLAGAIALQAFCVWCLASLAIIAALFAVVSLRRPNGAPGVPRQPWLLGSALLVVAVLGAMHLLATGLPQRPESPRMTALVAHLHDSGVKYYGASWCANCRRQSRLFGASAERLPYVECAPNGRTGAVAFECTSAGITAYPTWVIRGEQVSEVLEPARLAELTGFDWDAADK
ncbi:vitamin K epoxide reductase family protein [Luteimonas sp. BDR2-5]|uniref:vitamin K epoxide reductase family protein n=1 Tax=Proluteimonas luteida TaxID=2878685 RepID=UPI001E4C2D20|nr:vitamin K epoxide reductase family protein [Luteimonas sp. BDR2-5]